MRKFLGLVRKLDKPVIRNYALLCLILFVCAGGLVYVLVSGERTIAKIDDQVNHTYNVINNAQELSKLVEGMLAAQRGFIITKEDKFLEKFHERRDKVSELIADLSELTSDNQSQVSRLDELRHYFSEFSVALEKRAQTFTVTSSSKIVMNDLETIDGMKDSILRINSSILEEEYGILNRRIDEIDLQKSRYFITLIVGILITSVMLFFFNSFLLSAQRKRNLMEAFLKDTEERFALAIEGTQDGIFDWDIETDQVFYSRRFFTMLGYDRDSFTGTTAEFRSLLHPEDAERVWQYIEQYLNSELSEYSQEFRVKSHSGRWIWINARAKAIFGPNGRPVRMVGAHTDITHIKESEEQLKAEKQQAEEANRAKSDFLAHMSHEIRTPLTAISGIAEIFEKKRDNFDAKQLKLVNTLHSSVAILKDLINDILDFSKIESGELELNEDSFRLGSAFQEIIDIMILRANEKGIDFSFDYDDVKEISFYGDEARLRQILINLIGNALKFTEGGGVKVRAHIEKREGNASLLRVDVSDTGIGIAEENFDLVFERFKQADASVSRKYGGTGLGLPISRNLARLMGGDILLKSEIGKGSTFSVFLPLRLQGEEDNKKNLKELDAKLSDKIRASLNGESRILIVEDYEGNIVVLGYMLDDLGFGYDVARTGLEAMNFWKERHYDLILMDIQMPEMDGFTATKLIRMQEQEKSFPRTPIIGMTAHALVGDKDKCISAGMDSYLPKPLVETDLKKQILKYINLKKKAA